MPQIIEAADGIYRVEFDDSRAVATTEVYFVRGDLAAIIETGPSILIPELLQALRLLNWDKEEVAYVIPTHIHMDHAGGVGRLMQELPRAQVVAYGRAARHLIDPTKLVQGTRQTYGDNFE